MTQTDKLKQLLSSDRRLFHTQDLALLWAIENRDTLYTTIKRYVKKDILKKVVKGLYSTVPIGDLNIYELGSSLLHKFCYVSFETILVREGVIFQKIYPITFAAPVSKKIILADNYFLYRQIRDEILYDPNGVTEKNGYFEADTDRAIKDMKYLNPSYYFDNLK